MSTLSIANPTLLDFTKELGQDGKIITDIAEILNMTNEILPDMTVTEGNLTTGHKFLMRTGIPSPTWLKVNGFLQPGKATTVPVQQSCGHLASLCQIDPLLGNLGGNMEAFRRNQEVAHIEGMAEEMAQTLFSGNEATEPEAFTGLGPYYNLSTGNENSCNVLKTTEDAASTNSDIWLVGWAPTKIHGFFPQGSQAGLKYTDLGTQLIAGSTAGTMAVRLSSQFEWDLGLAIEDWRYCARSHWGTTSADAYISAGTGTTLINQMIQMTELMPSLSNCRPVFYMSRTGLTKLRLQTLRATSSTLTFETVGGKPVTMFNGIPVRRCDAILNNQAALTA